MKKTDDLRNYVVRVPDSSLKPLWTNFGWQAQEGQRDLRKWCLSSRVTTQPFWELVTLCMKSVSPHSQKLSRAYFPQHQHQPGIRRPSLRGPFQPCLPHGWLGLLVLPGSSWRWTPGCSRAVSLTCSSLCLQHPSSTSASKNGLALQNSAQSSLSVKPSRLFLAFYLEHSSDRAVVQFSSVAQSCLTLWPHGLQHARPPCPSPTPGVFSNPCPLSRWCHPTISSCCPLLLLPSIFPSIGVFSNESALHFRWPK